MTPQELKHGSPRTYAMATPDIDESTAKDFLDGDRVFTLETLNRYQAQTKAWWDNTVSLKEFDEGDLILIRTSRTESRGKLKPKWKGPFIIKKKTSPNSYKLTTQSGKDLKHSWNIDNLRKFYV
jgi:ribosomal protein L21E